MEKLHFKITINAPASNVYHAVIDDQLFREWTAAFNPTSYYEGSWNKGDKILFIGIGKEGKREGMVANIAENIVDKQISIHHIGLLDGDKEITKGPEVEKWANAMEEYFLEEKNGVTTFKVAVDCNSEFLDYFKTTWPRALDKLKEISER